VVSWCVLTFSFELFCLPCNVFHLLPHRKLVRTINFTARLLFICFKTRIYSIVEPLSCFFVASSLSPDIEIGALNIDPSRRRLQGFPKKNHGNQFCMHVEEHIDGSCMLQILCLCLWKICSMFWPKELGPISMDRYTVLNILFFFNEFTIKNFPWSLGCCFFSEFNTSSHWHGSIVS
jgi:hypothetical protein